MRLRVKPDRPAAILDGLTGLACNSVWTEAPGYAACVSAITGFVAAALGS